VIAARGVVLVAASATVAVGSGFLIGYPAEVGAATSIALAALVALIATRHLAARSQLQPWARPVRRVTAPAPPQQLRYVREALASAEASEVGVDRDLRPLVRPIAAMRLARLGVDLDRHPEEARAILGEPLWELVRADRARGANLVAGGISAAGLQSLIERLERI
jgi:hypothetical protein